jgi:hypothetical protein
MLAVLSVPVMLKGRWLDGSSRRSHDLGVIDLLEECVRLIISRSIAGRFVVRVHRGRADVRG